jgi:predicted dehydrogenase
VLGAAWIADVALLPAIDGSSNGRLVALASRSPERAREILAPYSQARVVDSYDAMLELSEVDAVYIPLVNNLHVSWTLRALAHGKHVLCEKPLAPTVADAEAMVEAAEKSDRVAAVGFTFRRSPAINAIREQITGGSLGTVMHFNGHYWCDYGFSKDAPMSWRYKGGPGSGALSDIGSHLVDLGEFLAGPVESVRGAILSTLVPERPVPLGTVVGHAAGVAVSQRTEPVENEDVVTFIARFASGAVGTFSVSRIAYGLPNSLGFEVFCEGGAAAFDLARASEFTIADGCAPEPVNGYRQVLIGPGHPYITRGLPMDFPSVGHGQNDLFVFQARAFLDQIAGLDRLPPCPALADGLHNMRVLEAVTAAADAGGEAVKVR